MIGTFTATLALLAAIAAADIALNVGHRRAEPPIILSIVRWMSFIEKLVVSLLAGFIVASIAILASALPNIYSQEESIRCGSLGVTNLVIGLIPGFIWGIIIVSALCYIGRTCISVTFRWIHDSGLRWSCAGVGGTFWLSGALSGVGGFAWLLTAFTNMLHNPPPLPPNLNDVKACSEFISNTKPSDYYDPFKEWGLVPRASAPGRSSL
jgi:hypothetical protein